jgi:plasmid stabilization system protein ParE
MYQVEIADSAEQDLEAIAEFIALDNPYRAISFVQDIQLFATDVLSECPWSGKKIQKGFLYPL